MIIVNIANKTNKHSIPVVMSGRYLRIRLSSGRTKLCILNSWWQESSTIDNIIAYGHMG